MVEIAAPLALASVIARQGRTADAAARLREAEFRLPCNIACLATGPGQWLVVVEPSARDALAAAVSTPEPDLGTALEQVLQAQCGDTASVTDQTGSRIRFAVTGSRANELLSRGVAIDLHPTRFAVGAVAVTAIGHMGVCLVKVDAAPTYHLLVARSYADSFRHWLQAAAAGLGGG